MLARVNGTVGDPASFDELEELLDAQSYRLAYWRVAAEEINYRRFFAINDLAAIRQEEPDVFDATHHLLLSLIGDGQVSGVRIDHPDGLWDPAGYLQTLQHAAFLSRVRAAVDGRRSKPIDDATWESWQPELDELWANRTGRSIRSIWWSRRSWKPASSFRRIGRWRAPLAMSSPVS